MQRSDPGAFGLSLGCALWASASLSLMMATAHAQSTACGQAQGRQVELEATPDDGASNVARDAPIFVRFESAAALDALLASVRDEPRREPCSSRPVCLLDGRDLEHPIDGTLKRVDADQLALLPERLLAPDSEHWLLVARPGLDRVSRAELAFSTGAELDREPPQLPFDKDEVVLELDALPAECDAPSGSVRVRVETPALEDDADPASVSLLVFLSRAAGLAAPMLRARVRNDGDHLRADFVLSPEQAREHVCVALRAVDGVGRYSQDEHELCFKPTRDVAFASGCTLGGYRGALLRPSRGQGGVWVTLATACAVLTLGRARLKWRKRSGASALRALLPWAAVARERAQRARPS